MAHRDLWKVDLKLAQKMLDDGAQVKDVAEKFGVTPTYITILKREGKLSYSRKFGNRAQKSDIPKIQSMISRGCSVAEIARSTGISRSGIYKMHDSGRITLLQLYCPHCGHKLRG